MYGCGKVFLFVSDGLDRSGLGTTCVPRIGWGVIKFYLYWGVGFDVFYRNENKQKVETSWKMSSKLDLTKLDLYGILNVSIEATEKEVE